MVLDEQDCVDRINAYARQDWQPLFGLIPIIENTVSFGEWAGGDRNEKGVVQTPYFVPADVVYQFENIVYAMPIVIGFDWAAWDEGRNMASDENFDFDSVDLITKCKLITAIVRNDRFCEGALRAAFESGLILNILKSMEEDVSGNRQ